MSGMLQAGRRLLIVALALGYAFIAHYTNTQPHMETLGTVVALAPILFGVFTMAWHSPHRKTMMSLFVLACVVMLGLWSRLEHHYDTIYWIEHAGTEAFLCMVFGRTLYQGREPMVTYFARMVHGSLTPALARYTRHVTQAWVWFFGSMAAVSTLLFFAAPLKTWSFFANFFTAPLIILMFIIEYAVRRQMLPEMEHAHILDGVKAFWKTPAR